MQRLAILAVVLFALLACGSSSAAVLEPARLSPELARTSAATIDPRELDRNTEAYTGQVVHAYGEVIQVIEIGAKSYQFRVRLGDVTDYAGPVVFARWRGDRFLYGDHVELWGRVRGRLTYETVLGGEMTVPDLDVYDMVALPR